jgi:hypothetical protein
MNQATEKMPPKLTPIPPFNPHGKGCSGHQDSYLDCTYEEQSERDLLVRCLSNYIVE